MNKPTDNQLLNQIVMTAYNIERAGKKPSLALLKAKLGHNLPMPSLIDGLQRYRAMSGDELALLQQSMGDTDHKRLTKEKLSQQPSTEQQLAQMLKMFEQLQKRQQQTDERVTQLEAIIAKQRG